MFDRALQIDPKNADTYHSKGILFDSYLGIALQNLGKCNEAIIMYDRSLELNPNDLNSYLNKGKT